MHFSLKKIIKIMIKGLLAIVALLICLFFGLALYNHYSDEDLSPEAATYFSTPIIKAPPPETNAVFAVWGLRAAEGKNPHAEGLAYWKRAQLAIKTKQPVPDAPADLALPESWPQCPNGELDCQRWLMEQVNVEELVRKHRVVLERYRQLVKYPTFVSPHTGSEVFHGVLAFQTLGVHRLWELNQLLRLGQGKEADFVSELASDIRFWSKASSEAKLLVDKMMANSFIQQDYKLLASAGLKFPQLFKTHPENRDGLLAPLPTSYFDMRGAMWGEHSTAFHVFHTIAVDGFVESAQFVETNNQRSGWESLGSKLSLWFYQEHATQNELYRQMVKIRALQQLPPERLIQLKESDAFNAECGVASWSMLKNPLGKTLVCIGLVDWSVYPLKLHRTEAMRRLVIIQTQLLQHAPSEYAQLIQNLPADLRNPQNGKPPRLIQNPRHLEFDSITREGKLQRLRVGLP